MREMNISKGLDQHPMTIKGLSQHQITIQRPFTIKDLNQRTITIKALHLQHNIEIKDVTDSLFVTNFNIPHFIGNGSSILVFIDQ